MRSVPLGCDAAVTCTAPPNDSTARTIRWSSVATITEETERAAAARR
jgi:hypothetical protein